MRRNERTRRRTDSTRNWRLLRAPRPVYSILLAFAVPLVVMLVLTYGHATIAAASSLLAVRVARRHR